MSQPVAFTHKGVEYKPFPQYGCFFGVTTYEGRTVLEGVAMLEDGKPEDLENRFDVSNTDGDPTFVSTINAAFGTAFTEDSFPGR